MLIDKNLRFSLEVTNIRIMTMQGLHQDKLCFVLTEEPNNWKLNNRIMQTQGLHQYKHCFVLTKQLIN